MPRRPTDRTPLRTPSRPEWRCDVCQEPVTEGGSLYFSYSEWQRFRKADSEWRQAHTDEKGWIVATGLELGDLPECRWHVVHDACDSAAMTRSDLYWIDIPRINTWAKAAEWSAHLHGKEWHADTDWGSLLFRAGVGAADA